MSNDAFLHTVRELSDQIIALQSPIRILDAINWGNGIREDFRLISELHEHEILISPVHIPPHFQDLRGLVTWLSVGRFIGSVRFEQLERDYSILF